MTKELSSPDLLRVVLTPYDVYNRTPVALASCLLADNVISFLPVANVGCIIKDDLHTQFPASVKTFVGFEWFMELGAHGITRPTINDRHASEFLPYYMNFIRNHDATAFMCDNLDPRVFGNEMEIMEAFAADLLDANGRSFFRVAMDASLMTFAMHHGAVVGLESTPPHEIRDVVSWPEGQAVTQVLKEVLPFIKTPTAEQILAARDVLKDELGPFRIATRSIAKRLESGDDDIEVLIGKELLPALRDYRSAFMSRRERFVHALSGTERDWAVGAMAFSASLISGLPIAAAPASALAGWATSVGLRYAQKAASDELKRRTHVFGFLAALEGR